MSRPRALAYPTQFSGSPPGDVSVSSPNRSRPLIENAVASNIWSGKRKNRPQSPGDSFVCPKSREYFVFDPVFGKKTVKLTRERLFNGLS